MRKKSFLLFSVKRTISVRLMMVPAIALLLMCVDGWAQGGTGKGTVRGRVIDVKTKEPLPSTNVTVKGTYYGAVSDFDGDRKSVV